MARRGLNPDSGFSKDDALSDLSKVRYRYVLPGSRGAAQQVKIYIVEPSGKE
jgi:hypothetical protein